MIPSTCVSPAHVFTSVRETPRGISRVGLNFCSFVGTYYALFSVGAVGIVYATVSLIKVRLCSRVLCATHFDPHGYLGQEDRVK
jgi:hypothetical protein